jgi:hypothetical protein
MFSFYNQLSNDYSKDLKSARQTAANESNAFNTLIQNAINQKSEGPSKAEMYFRLAAAFGTPTKTGNFFEGLSEAGKVMSEFEKEKRTASLADIARKQQLGISAQQAKMLSAKQDVDTIRALTAEEMRDRRAIITKQLEQYIASGKPQSEAGKIAADSGLKIGTPEYNKFVDKYVQHKIDSSDMYKNLMSQVAVQTGVIRASAEARKEKEAAKLTPNEMKLKADTENELAGIDQAMSDLRLAFKLNPNTFDASYVSKAQRMALEAANSKHPKVIATNELDNLLGSQALAKIKTIFGGNPTEGEREMLLSLQGLGAKSIEEREVVMKNLYKTLQNSRHKTNTRLNDIKAGSYRDTTPDITAE